MINTKILSGIEASHALYDSLHERIGSLKDKGITPGLAAILVGEDPASQIYVRNKTKRFDALGLKSELHRLINAASRLNGLSYSNFVHLLKEKGVDLDRKVLAHLAVNNPSVFEG